jgi:hypothetical protein
MATKRLSTILKVKAKDLEQKGVFNAFIDLDSKLHVDPSLLVKSKLPEFKGSYKKFANYFIDLIKIINSSSAVGDSFWNAALKRLTFKEHNSVSLGYSENSARGSGIGKRLAKNILTTANAIIKAGVKDPEIFELIGIFEEDIGADRISDMSIRILENEFKIFTQRVSKELKIKTSKKEGFQLPINPKTKKSILFVPVELLRDLPIATSWSDIDYVSKYNDTLRASLNQDIGSSWKAVTKNMKKHEIKDFIISQPEVLKDLIRQYREKPRSSYNFKEDPAGEVVWASLSQQAERFPIDLKEFKKTKLSCNELIKLVTIMCVQFGKLLESNGWNEFLYLHGKLRNERFPQKLFYGVADVYCEANDLDLTRESNAGIGALDFKVSKGKQKVSVEIKYSKNQNLINGFEVQLPAYVKSESACAGIYLVIQVAENDKKLKMLEKLKGKHLPHLMIVDGRIKPSASKRKK